MKNKKTSRSSPLIKVAYLSNFRHCQKLMHVSIFCTSAVVRNFLALVPKFLFSLQRKMCCCELESLCCGNFGLSGGCKLWAVIDLVHSIVLSILVYFFVLGDNETNLYTLIGSIIGAIILNPFLFFGAQFSNRCLIITWLVFAMLQIIGYFLSALSVFLTVALYLVQQ